MYPDSIKNLVEAFKYLPGIGTKTAERLAFSVLNLEDEQVSFFSNSILEIKNKIHKCPECNSLTDEEVCSICIDQNRDNRILCVVEDSKTVFLFERLGIFRGKYHVLEGLISPLEGINPEDIGIEKLLERLENGQFEEIIFAFRPSIEGETTSLYIKRIVEGMQIKTSRLASGIPIGADIEFIDSLTLERALADRKTVE